MKFTIEDLRDRKCVLLNDGTKKQLEMVLKEAFPIDKTKISDNLYKRTKYFESRGVRMDWIPLQSSYGLLPIQSVKVFLEEIEGKKQPKSEYPKVMWVNNDDDISKACKRVVFAEKKGVYISWVNADNLEDAEFKLFTFTWKYAWELSEREYTIKMTIQEIKDKLNLPDLEIIE